MLRLIALALLAVAGVNAPATKPQVHTPTHKTVQHKAQKPTVIMPVSVDCSAMGFNAFVNKAQRCINYI